jgi:PKD repeat protein
MESRGRRVSLFALAFALVALAQGATYLPISDAELADRSPVIVRAQVLDVSMVLEKLNGIDTPFTIVKLEVLEQIKGAVGSTMQLRLPGGRVGGLAWSIPGTPKFASGQEVILLARPAEGRPGVYHLSEFGLGHFDIVQDQNGERFATRPVFQPEDDLYLAKRPAAMAERTQADGPAPQRHADSFIDALRAVASGKVMPEIAYAQPSGDLFSPRVFVIQREWANIGGVENGTNNLFRWFWDTGASPGAVVSTSGTQSVLSDSSNGIPHVQNGVDQWHAGVPATDIHISGVTPGGNITVFLDATSSFDGGAAWNTALPCSTGGVIGLGGPGPSSGPKTFKGETPYFAPSSGTVSMRQRTGSAGCYSAAVFRTAVMHELGHVLGLHHPDQFQSIHSTTTSADWDAAVMHSVVPAGTPSTPQTDDMQAMQYYYGTAACSPPTAAFSFLPASPTAGQTVSFTDQSTGAPTSWSWNFGDPSSGGSNTSTLENPTHSFASGGAYNVTLTVAAGTCSSTPVSHSVVATAPPTAAFTFSPPSPTTGQTVSFTDTSTGSPTSWSWNFGDASSGGANTSTLRNPTHTFATANTYTVTLTATNGAGPSTPVMHSVSVSNPVPPTAAFTFSPPSLVTGQSVFFTDTSTGSPTSWSWNFGDGVTSAAQNPVKAYGSPNTYTVTLTAMSGLGSSMVSHMVVVSAAGSAPGAAFTFFPASPQPGQMVPFLDTSSGGPTSWFWSFGDGFSSLAENPTHPYASSGTYTVSLTAQNSFGSSQVTHSVTVSSVSAPTAVFTFSPPSPQPGQIVAITDTSAGGPTTWAWDFGDGSGSSFQNPSHAYIAAGNYTVRLTVSNVSGSSQTTRSVAVRVPTPCSADPGVLPANAGHNFCVTLQALDERTGHTGPGLAIPKNDHFGYFSIPAITSDPGNPEVFVKVLDGRAVNGFFWVFYGGLTDLQYTLTVLDFQTGSTRQYTKPAGSASGGFDVLAFSGGGSAVVEAAPAQAPGVPPALRVEGGCAGDIATLCLDAARGFTVTLAARDPRTGLTGPGQAIAQSDLFGYFSIPALTSDVTNPEVFVKVLDGRAVNGHFWVFYGGLTDLEYTITVRDTVTGNGRTYFKSGGSADGGFDVLAF